MINVTSIIAEVLRLRESDITDDLAIVDVDTWDSLAHMELIAALEEAYALTLTADEIVEMTSVRAIKRVISERGVG